MPCLRLLSPRNPRGPDGAVAHSTPTEYGVTTWTVKRLREMAALITDSTTSSHERFPRSRKQLACGDLQPTSWQLVATVAEFVIKAEMAFRPDCSYAAGQDRSTRWRAGPSTTNGLAIGDHPRLSAGGERRGTNRPPTISRCCVRGVLGHRSDTIRSTRDNGRRSAALHP